MRTDDFPFDVPPTPWPRLALAVRLLRFALDALQFWRWQRGLLVSSWEVQAAIVEESGTGRRYPSCSVRFTDARGRTFTALICTIRGPDAVLGLARALEMYARDHDRENVLLN